MLVALQLSLYTVVVNICAEVVVRMKFSSFVRFTLYKSIGGDFWDRPRGKSFSAAVDRTTCENSVIGTIYNMYSNDR